MDRISLSNFGGQVEAGASLVGPPKHRESTMFDKWDCGYLPPAYASPHHKSRIASIIAIAMAPPKTATQNRSPRARKARYRLPIPLALTTSARQSACRQALVLPEVGINAAGRPWL